MLKRKTFIVVCLCCLVTVFWSCASSGSTAQNLFYEAESCARNLRNSPAKLKYRSYWVDCIQKFELAVAKDPSGPWAAAGLYQMGGLYAELYRYSRNNDDLREAEKLYQHILREYPQSGYRDRAAKDLAALPVKASEPVSLADVNRKDDIQSVIGDAGTEKTKAPAAPETAGSGVKSETHTSPSPLDANNCSLTTVTGIRYWSNPDYTRVVIDADRPTVFQNNLLKKDPSIEKTHQRLYVDLKNSRMGDIEKTIPINDSLLQAARAGQYTSDTVRVVIDINSFEDYNIFSLPNPFRIVIDVRGKSSPTPSSPGETIHQPNAASIARQLALGVRRIVIDPGHGGKDYGAPGYVKGVHEKYVVLDISKKLAGKIRKELGCEVVFTREKDEYLTLEERTAIANMKKGDLFISIHANASRNQRAFGIETYFLNLTADDESITVAARENATSEKNISELQTILNDLLQNAKINESSRLATYVQKSLCEKMESKYNRINNKGVKQAPFYVLIGAQMPAILIETSFISNKTECQRLTDPAYQNTLCDGIVAGIRQYIKETQPTAYFGLPDSGSGG